MYAGPRYNPYSVMNMANPEIWFSKLEARFYLQGITSQLDKYYYAVAELPSNAAIEVADLLKAVPEGNPYDQLKHGVITRLKQINEECQQRESSSVRSGNAVLPKMHQVAEGWKIDDTGPRQTGTERTRRVIGESGPAIPPNKPAESASVNKDPKAVEHPTTQFREFSWDLDINGVIRDLGKVMNVLTTVGDQKR
ncbi:unnamed protein product [Mesocestoides corti]|uniref:Gag_p30 domain-containing protein n=1 Tax=Mesocestoides corti TaxID=53468 RepID=A0A0R3UPN2_MESCO|nr:unnamed protein product [Mesocestoides corti]